MTVKTIIFDLGGVLINWDPRNMYRKIFKDEERMEYFLANITTYDWNEQQDAGRTWAEATRILVEQHPKWENEIRAYHARWTEMLDGAIQGTVDILTKLHQDKKYRLYALTNWSRETFPYALENFEFLQYFEGILVSGEEMMKKPDPRIYNLIAERYNIEKSTAVFIDDSLKNVKGSIDTGIYCIHFKSSEQLANDLRALGVEF